MKDKFYPKNNKKNLYNLSGLSKAELKKVM